MNKEYNLLVVKSLEKTIKGIAIDCIENDDKKRIANISYRREVLDDLLFDVTPNVEGSNFNINKGDYEHLRDVAINNLNSKFKEMYEKDDNDDIRDIGESLKFIFNRMKEQIR